jgi:hypothetical protein
MERDSQRATMEEFMKHWRLNVVALALILAVAFPVAAADNPVFVVASILSGTFKGTTPGNELRLDLRSATTDSEHPYDMFLQCTGKYQGANVRRQGLMRLESQGGKVYLGYIPHFDPTVSSLSPEATRFTESEANAACGLNLVPRGDGFVGETPGSTCASAMRGALGKWTIEIEPGSIRLREVKSGETLRFTRVSKN